MAWKVSCAIEVSFFSIGHTGHTHEDIDQAFSRTSERIWNSDAATLFHVQTELETTYGELARVVHTNSIINWSGGCEQDRILCPVKPFSYLHYFSFSRSSRSQTSSGRSSGFCQVKVEKVENGYCFSPGKTVQERDSWKRFQILFSILRPQFCHHHARWM